MTYILIMMLTILVGLLYVLFYFLNKKLENAAKRLGVVYSNIDVLHKNQEELLAQNLKMFHDSRKKKEDGN